MSDMLYAWGVDFSYGDGYVSDKNDYYYVLDVRGGQTEPYSHFVDNAD
jgi:hypothetical protein